MPKIQVQIQNVKGISNATLELPIENNIYALVGSNGSGKSTILQVLAQLIRPKSALFTLRNNDCQNGSLAHFTFDSLEDRWEYSENTWNNRFRVRQSPRDLHNNITMHGIYEGSLFVGTRFDDSTKVDDLIDDGKITADDVVDANLNVIRDLSYILHGDYTHYQGLKKLRCKKLREEHNLKNQPHFMENRYGGLISQYRMSSGECLLASLLDFIHNVVVEGSLPKERPVLMLLDEIELALHPKAVGKFLDLLEQLIKDYSNLTVILTTHAPEVIRRIKPSNTYMLENADGHVSCQTNVYPAYTIRELYTHDTYDFLILCEDTVTKSFVNHVIDKNNLRAGKRIHITPVGSWKNVLKLHDDLAGNFAVGQGTTLVSILDGDVIDRCNENPEYKPLKKAFLPIASVKKFLYSVLCENGNPQLKRVIGDKYFQRESIDTLIAKFNKKNPLRSQKLSTLSKDFYDVLIDDLSSRDINEPLFLEKLCSDIFPSLNNYQVFEYNLRSMLTR